MEGAMRLYVDRAAEDRRVLGVGRAAGEIDIGAVGAAPIQQGQVTFVATWTGRGGLGSRMFQEHGIVAIIYGGTVVDEDFRDRKVADEWFESKYHKRLAAKDLDATVKYRYDPKFDTGGTFGVNYSTVGGRLLAFNYRTIYWSEEERLALHKDFIVDHYLKQFNEETIATKSQRTCGEPCGAVCKKMRGEFKKDYEPYQTLGPMCGIFDQRAAEALNHHADTCGFDAISLGGVLSWLMECMATDVIAPEELGISEKPVFSPKGFSIEADSMHNARIGIALIDSIVGRTGILDMSEGARKLARRMARERGRKVLNPFVYSAFARKGWQGPDQYWTPGVL